MLDLQKYLKKAAADPGFKAKLLENANQAIKDEFGENLPYKLKCCKKLVFEVESMDGLNDEALEGVAGGTTLNLIPLETWKEGIEAAGYTLSTTLKKDDWGSHKYYDYDNYGNRRSKSVKLVKVDGEWYAQVE